MRKHRSQMTEKEINDIENYVHGNVFSILTHHVLQAQLDHGVTPEQVDSVLERGNVVEVRKKKGKNSPLRILVRGNITPEEDLCVVVSSVKVIITLWTNKVHDKHHTLDMSKYDADWTISLAHPFTN